MTTPFWNSADLPQLDQAIDYAARVCKATVSEFLAAPAASDNGTSPGIEIAIEFFVPPASVEQFRDELDRAMVRRSIAYSAARRAGHAKPVRLSILPPSAFGQWRAAWKINPRAQHARRWSSDRQMLEAVIRQAANGWREIFGVA